MNSLKPSAIAAFRAWMLAGAACLAIIQACLAFPPAPHHLIYGTVRTEYGDPISVRSAEVILKTSSGVEIKTKVIPELGSGMNYRLVVPMDSGLFSASYQPSALQPAMPFRLSVKIGTSTFLPIEMSGNYASMGQPARGTRVDLTLGEDSDGDGLPDAWEYAMIALLGGGTLADIHPEDDSDNDGLSNLSEYLAGTYAFDPADGFKLGIIAVNAGHPTLEFTAITGRQYSVFGSRDMIEWSPMTFRQAGAVAPVWTEYRATDVRILRIEALALEDEPARFFKLMVR